MTILLTLLRKHWPVLAAVLVLLALVTWAYLQGAKVATAQVTAEYEQKLAERDRAAAAALTAALDQAQADAKAARDAERRHLQAQQQTDTQFRTITERVVEYVEKKPDLAACGLDADGLRYWNTAQRGGDAAQAARP